jgi:hypothetical protein
MMDGFDNNYSDSDDEKGKDNPECDNAELLSCKACGTEFDIGAKGVSRLKELCSTCHSSAVVLLLDDESVTASTQLPTNVSKVVEEEVEDANTPILPKVLTTSHTIKYH